jgi:hypothetical protein
VWDLLLELLFLLVPLVPILLRLFAVPNLALGCSRPDFSGREFPRHVVGTVGYISFSFGLLVLHARVTAIVGHLEFQSLRVLPPTGRPDSFVEGVSSVAVVLIDRCDFVFGMPAF